MSCWFDHDRRKIAHPEARKVVAEKKERKNFAQDAVEELTKWFASHLDHPYLDEEDREELARKTNLNVAQVSTALSRFARSRSPPHVRFGTAKACEGTTLSACVAGELLGCERPEETKETRREGKGDRGKRRACLDRGAL